MHSRTYLLLEREYQELKEAQIYGISATPRTDNLLEWVATVQGLKDSLWEGAVLQLSIIYTENYNSSPPSIMFHTIPFHPNVDPLSGKPCIDFLDNPKEWNPCFTMSKLLLTIQALLSNPVMENAVHLEAAELLNSKPSIYRDIVLNCVKTSRLIESDGAVGNVMGEVLMCEQERLMVPSVPGLGKPEKCRCITTEKIKSVSFEEYHDNWMEIATSKATEDLKHMRYSERSPKTPCNGKYKERNSNEVYNIVIHGHINTGTTLKQKTSDKDAQSSPLCRLPGTCNLSSATHVTGNGSKRTINHHEKTARSQHGEPWEEEVDTLVAWTNSLTTELLED
ncbi:ubiquitin-conjugating enzyme E2 U [Rhinophrynus dorsalis]